MIRASQAEVTVSAKVLERKKASVLEEQKEAMEQGREGGRQGSEAC